MNCRDRLSEYMQESIGEYVHLRYSSSKRENKYNVILHVGTQVLKIEGIKTKQLAKEQLARELLKQLRRLPTESSIRQHLGLSERKRNDYVSSVRGELVKVKRQLKHRGVVSAYKKMSQIYLLLDLIEKDLSWCEQICKGK